jgi:uncharacterized repeat protein (TIGR01451 family)
MSGDSADKGRRINRKNLMTLLTISAFIVSLVALGLSIYFYHHPKSASTFEERKSLEILRDFQIADLANGDSVNMPDASVYGVGVLLEVSEYDMNTWGKSIDANRGDLVDFRITYSNVGALDQTDVTMRALLSADMSYVPNSTQVANAKTKGELEQWSGNDAITVDGINASANGAGFLPITEVGRRSYVVVFTARIYKDARESVCENKAIVSVTIENERYFNTDEASVRIVG